VLLAPAQQQEGVVGPLLAKLARARGHCPRDPVGARKLPRFKAAGAVRSERLEAALNPRVGGSQRLKDEYCSTEHLLIGIAQDKSGAAARILAKAGVTPEAITRPSWRCALPAVTDANPRRSTRRSSRYAKI